MNHCITRISDLKTPTLLWKWYIADMTILNGLRLNTALDVLAEVSLHRLAEVSLHRRKNRIDKIQTKKRIFMHSGMYFIALMLLFCFLMICRDLRQWGRILGSQVFTNEGGLRRLDCSPCRAINLYHCLCESQCCWEEGGWKQHSAIRIVLAGGWRIDTSENYISCQYNHFVNCDCCGCWSARPQLKNPTASRLPGGDQWRWLSTRPWYSPKLWWQYYCWIGKVGNEIRQPHNVLLRLLWPTSGRLNRCPDGYAWLPQLPYSWWHHSTTSGGYDR